LVERENQSDIGFSPLFEPGLMGWEDRPRSGKEPGCPSTPLRVRDERMDQDQYSDGRAASRPGTGLLLVLHSKLYSQNSVCIAYASREKINRKIFHPRWAMSSR